MVLIKYPISPIFLPQTNLNDSHHILINMEREKMQRNIREAEWDTFKRESSIAADHAYYEKCRANYKI